MATLPSAFDCASIDHTSVVSATSIFLCNMERIRLIHNSPVHKFRVLKSFSLLNIHTLNGVARCLLDGLHGLACVTCTSAAMLKAVGLNDTLRVGSYRAYRVHTLISAHCCVAGQSREPL